MSCQNGKKDAKEFTVGISYDEKEEEFKHTYQNQL